MNSDTAIADIMNLLNVTTPAGAVDAVQNLLNVLANVPAIAINSDGTMNVAKGLTVGQVLRLLAAAQQRVEGIAIA